MWHEPYIVKRALEKGVYELVDYDEIPFGKAHKWSLPKNILCLDCLVKHLYINVPYFMCDSF